MPKLLTHKSALAFTMLLCSLLGSALGTEPFSTMDSYLAEGRYDLAVQVEGPRLIEAYPQEAEAFFLYSHALYLTGNSQEARLHIDRALALSPDEPRYRWLEALIGAEEGHAKSAEDTLQTLFDSIPSYSLAMDWGRVAWQAGDYDGAISAFKAAQQTEEGRVQAWPYLNEARLLGYLDRYEEAIEVLQTAIDILETTDTGDTTLPSPNPAYVEAIYLVGEAYERLEQYEEAIANYYSALLYDPLHQPSRLALNRLEEQSR
jgi:tetratricopeptide (TPR) repeat protein